MRRVVIACLLFLAGFGSGQDVQLNVGFDGELVAGRWNPIEFSFRDQALVTLTLTIDQGDLRSGAIPAVYRFALEGGPGLSVVEEDVFIPAWQSFSWTAATQARVLASGTFHPRDMDSRPLAVILSTSANRHAHLVPSEFRPVALPSARLPERLAAWDGVALLLIDGTTAPPPLEAIVSAAAAGATVALMEPLPASFSELGLLDGRIGAGRVIRGAPGELADSLYLPFDHASIDALLDSRGDWDLPRPLSVSFILPAALLYSLLAVLLWRLAGLPGAVAVICVGFLAIALAWPSLRSGGRLETDAITVRISAGGLSRSLTVRSLLDRTGGNLVVDGYSRPLEPHVFRTGDGQTEMTMQRWRMLELAGRPELAPAGNVSGSTTDAGFLEMFPAGSSAFVSDGLIEVFVGDGNQP